MKKEELKGEELYQVYCSLHNEFEIPTIKKTSEIKRTKDGGRAEMFSYEIKCSKTWNTITKQDLVSSKHKNLKLSRRDFCPDCAMWVEPLMGVSNHSMEIYCPECGYILYEM